MLSVCCFFWLCLLKAGTQLALAERVTELDDEADELDAQAHGATNDVQSVLKLDLQSHEQQFAVLRSSLGHHAVARFQAIAEMQSDASFFPILVAWAVSSIASVAGAVVSVAGAAVSTFAAKESVLAAQDSLQSAGNSLRSGVESFQSAGQASQSAGSSLWDGVRTWWIRVEGKADRAAAAAKRSATHAANSADIASNHAAAAAESASSAADSAAAAAASASSISWMPGLIAGAAIASLVALAVIVVKVVMKDPEDPMVKVEDRINQIIDGAFNRERRKRLAAKMKRYNRQLTLCTASWISQTTHSNGSKVVASMLQTTLGESCLRDMGFEHQEFHSKAIPDSDKLEKGASPPCLEQLQMHMSLERDAWMFSEGDSLDALFVPFSMMHTEILSVLVDHPPAGSYENWRKAAEQTAGEYAAFIYGKLRDAWVSQTCRSIRLREKKKGFWSKAHSYELIALVPEFQPHAGEDCWKKCGEQRGWCNWCGGKDAGACCKKGETETMSECKKIDIPEANHLFGLGKGKHICVHADCQQEGAKYTNNIRKCGDDIEPENVAKRSNPFAKILNLFKGDLAFETEDWIFCQGKCQECPACKTWTWYKETKKCNLQDGTGKRVLQKGAISGPRFCPGKGAAPADEDRQSMREAAEQEDKTAKPPTEEVPNFPTDEESPCNYSQPIDWEKFDEGIHPYVETCYPLVMKAISGDFNEFYSKFAKTFDNLAHAAGCNETKKEQAEYVDLWDQISLNNNFSEWKTCKWEERLQKLQKNKNTWIPEYEKSKDGSKITFLKQKLLPAFPGPEWLERRRALLPCIKKTQVRDGQDAEREFEEALHDS
eukprot:TRINITY_DN4242_c0_g1_i1.p1 TRINITY_DN4242_c0_g1~~TRINITY_DN4242_c0_g1_i1.p1  ORF type:complete len:831 (+),score=154.48 TRINITY_DN4242_c0_g1_i1:66-2558(+)